MSTAYEGVMKQFDENGDEMILYPETAKQDLLAQTLGYPKLKKNLLPFVDSGSITVAGITWTRNADGTITANGTATENSYCGITEDLALPTGDYILTSGDGVNSNVYVYIDAINKSDGSWAQTLSVSHDARSQFTFTQDMADTYKLSVGCVIKSGATVSNYVFKPMLRSANILDDTYEPYVKDVDKRFNEINSKMNDCIDAIYTNQYFNFYFYFYKKNGIVQIYAAGKTADSVPTGSIGTIFTVSEEFRPIHNFRFLPLPFDSEASKIQFAINEDGTCDAYNYGSAVTKADTCRIHECYISKN